MLSLREALATMTPAFRPTPLVRVALHQATGRHLGESLSASYDVPGFDNSAMDGYAVRAADAGAGAELPVVGESRAGGAWPSALAPSSAMRIFTGAPVPEGADAVVMQENTRRTGDRVRLLEAATVGRHIRRRAEAIACGGALLPAGSRLSPGAIGMLASQGIASVPVRARPRVALLSTGDELRGLGSELTPGQLFDSNSHALAAAVRQAGADAFRLPLCGDRRDDLARAVRDGIRLADVLLTTGGVSVGDYDLLHEVFEQVGVEPRFWKVRVKPGKPVWFGVAGEVPVVGLPGNPGGALVTFEMLVRPQLRRMVGDPKPFRARVPVALGWEARAAEGRTRLVGVRLEGATAHRASWAGPGSTASMATIDGYAVLPAGAGVLPPGSTVSVLDLRGPTSAASAFD